MRHGGISRLFQEYRELTNIEYDLRHDLEHVPFKFRRNKDKFDDLICWDRGRWYRNKSWKLYRKEQWK